MARYVFANKQIRVESGFFTTGREKKDEQLGVLIIPTPRRETEQSDTKQAKECNNETQKHNG